MLNNSRPPTESTTATDRGALVTLPPSDSVAQQSDNGATVNGYHDQWEPPKGGWGCLLIIMIAGWALIYFLYDTLKELLR